MDKERRFSREKSIDEQKDEAERLFNEFDMNKRYTDSDFDKMLIPLYSWDGRPFMDEFEYEDTVFYNNGVEKLRKKYFDQKRAESAEKRVKKRNPALDQTGKDKPDRKDSD
jgi:hypothetical protein